MILLLLLKVTLDLKNSSQKLSSSSKKEINFQNMSSNSETK